MGKSFYMKCPQCGTIFKATEKDICQPKGSSKQQYVPCPKKYTYAEVKAGLSLKTYCTGYPAYPACIYKE